MIPMQIENTKTCIISGSSFYPEKREKLAPKKTADASRGAKKPKTLNFSFLRKLGREMRISVRISRKKALCTLGSVAACTAAVYALSTYCTIGISCYHNNKLICTVAASDNTAAIISAAVKKASDMGVKGPQIETAAKIALKSDITDGKNAVNRILSAAPELATGYVVFAGGVELFTADSRESVEAAINRYIEKYKLNDSAQLSADIEITEKIVHREDITPSDTILNILDESGALSVMNTVEFTQKETLAHEKREIPDDNLYVGESVVETPGSDGMYVTVDRQIYSNTELLSSCIIKGETCVEPVTEVVRVGTKMKNALEDGIVYPVHGKISSDFGPRWGRQHRGIDIAVVMNTPVAAAAYGTVITAQYKESYGNLVQIDHGYGIITSYAHLNTIDVSLGQRVSQGEIIAHSGSTGNSTGPHLHFEIINNGEYLNPSDYLS